MYSGLSQDFLDKMEAPAQRRRLLGTIGTATLYPSNIVKSTAKISLQCSDNNDIQIGQVYIGQLNITLRGLNIPSGGYKGKEIVLYEGLEVSEKPSTYEDVLLGHFFIEKPEWTTNGVECVCYDAMRKFDKSMSLSTTTGKLYNFISLACQRCGVTLGMTQQQIEAMPNGNETLYIYKENDMSEYRDLISWCAQTMGANALIDRNGHLIFKNYSMDDVYTFTAKDRIGSGSKHSDFVSYYTGISMVNIEAMTTSYYGLSQDDGSVMNLGSNPLLQPVDDTPEAMAAIEVLRRRILTSISVMRYTPFNVKIHRPMVFDLMDVIVLTGGLIGNSPITSCITKMDWSFLGGYNISCSGSDPALASAKSKTDKNLSGLMSSTTEVKNEISEVSTIVQQQSVDISGKQNKINLEIIEPTYDADECDLVFVGTEGNSNKDLYRREHVGDNEDWIRLDLMANNYIITSNDPGEGVPLEEGHFILVYEE